MVAATIGFPLCCCSIEKDIVISSWVVVEESRNKRERYLLLLKLTNQQRRGKYELIEQLLFDYQLMSKGAFCSHKLT